MEGASSRDRVRPSLSRALQVFPGGNRRLLLPGRSLRGAERPACKPVEQAESWRWSSLRRVEREDTAFPILSAWPLPRPTDWLQLVNQPQTEAEVEALRCCVNRGRPFGDPNWVTDTAERLGLNGRFGLAEDRRNNHKACHSCLYSPDLVAVTFTTFVASHWRRQGCDLSAMLTGKLGLEKKPKTSPQFRSRLKSF